MPQDIPVEASETLVFKLPSLAEDEGAPTFTLRTATPREKRQHRRLTMEEGLGRHGDAEIRAAILEGLKASWTEEQFAEHGPVIEAFWEAQDEFALQRKAEPEFEWSYDAELERGIHELIDHVIQATPRVRRMFADNRQFEEMTLVLIAAVIVKDFTGLKVRRDLDRGYLTTDCADTIKEELDDLAREKGLPLGSLWLELAMACLARMYLDEEESKNFVSPSLSKTTQPASNPTTTSVEQDGASPESTASSTATPEAA